MRREINPMIGDEIASVFRLVSFDIDKTIYSRPIN